MEIKKTCLMAKLPKCYEGHVLNAHAAYLLEALKVTSILVALHLDSKGGTSTDVATCPVFVANLSGRKRGDRAPTASSSPWPQQNPGGQGNQHSPA